MDTILEHENSIAAATTVIKATSSIFATMEITDAGAACDCDCGGIDNY